MTGELPNFRHVSSANGRSETPVRMVASAAWISSGKRSAAAVASALLLFAAFPPLEWTGLAFVAWVPLLFAQAGSGPWVRRGLGGLFLGVLFAAIATSVNPPEVATGVAWIGISIGIGVLAGLTATLLDVPVGPERVIKTLGPWSRVWVPAVAWTGIEYLRLVTTAGHQWGMLATTQVDVAPLRAWLPVAGMWPVALLTVATGHAVAAIVLVAFGRSAADAEPSCWHWRCGAGMAGGAGPGSRRKHAGRAVAPRGRGADRRPCAVASEDPAPDHDGALSRTDGHHYRNAHIGDAGGRAARRRLDRVAGGFGLGGTRRCRATPQLDGVRAVAERAGVPIVWSYFIRIDPNHTRNELVVVTPDGRMSRPTTKDHPVYAIGERSVTSGLYETYDVAGARLGLAAGPDGTYTDTLARLARMGAALVAIPTHDWAAYTAPHIQHLRLRAAEHGLAVAKADWRYGSVVIGPDGQVVAGTSLDRAEKVLLVADVRLASPGTLYTATGDWLGVASLGALAAMLAGTAVLAVRGRRVSGDRQERRTRPS